MLYQKDLTALDFTTNEQYYEYVWESYTNGQIKQTRELYNKLSRSQQKTFWRWLKNTPFVSSDTYQSMFETLVFED
jgi:hypothetical protein